MIELQTATKQLSGFSGGLGWLASFTFAYKVDTLSNQRRGTFGTARLVKKDREALFYCWVGARRPKPPRWPCRVTFTRIAPRPLDKSDNLPNAFKAMRDELARCIGLRNDAGPEVEWKYRQLKPQDVGLPKGTYHVKVEIEVEGEGA